MPTLWQFTFGRHRWCRTSHCVDIRHPVHALHLSLLIPERLTSTLATALFDKRIYAPLCIQFGASPSAG